VHVDLNTGLGLGCSQAESLERRHQPDDTCFSQTNRPHCLPQRLVILLL
jgi:hypothetical protein